LFKLAPYLLHTLRHGELLLHVVCGDAHMSALLCPCVSIRP